MSETRTSQVRDAWKKMVDDQMARMELACAEMARVQEQALAQNRQAVDEMAKLSRESIDYMGQLSASFCKLTLEATKNAVGLFNVQG